MGIPSLDRFVAAQDSGDTYVRAVTELRDGRKTSHWMWFVFPQLAGLGSSPTARRYAVESLAEARAYLAHDVLGHRLRDCAELVTNADADSADEMFGSVDAMKLRSSMTLFALAAEDAGQNSAPFRAVLDRWYGGQDDFATLQMLGRAQPG